MSPDVEIMRSGLTEDYATPTIGISGVAALDQGLESRKDLLVSEILR
jgi:hypothetical protein